ncbi:hypothetical protein NP493_525g04003 [Ridgeia piscesae]|uniref:Uncharacterized protein n=1 Tax=Ridgeia piscesae TaxID=27915 RepID=A0AAD9KWE4_RIDPI|nr:hypothetical protein NP493_525g04003 [Ridgeia piscesae]
MQGSASLSTTYKTEVSFSVGMTWSKTSGTTRQPLRITPSSGRTYNGELVSKASVSVTATPSISATWPCVAKPKKKKGHQKGENNDITSLQLSAAFPIYVKVAGEACACDDPDRHTEFSITAGLDKVNLGLTVYKWKFEKSVDVKGATVRQGVCKANPAPCCVCKETGMPGKRDPKTKECLCKCFCDWPYNTVVSVKAKNGRCKCARCPDGSLQRWAAQVKCPCKCADGVEREMRRDGTCDCSCRCRDGVTRDTLAADGSCPCKCTCRNCAESTLGRWGCMCPGDVCPRCPAGGVATWKDCRCRCPSACGRPPACSAGRRGARCDQPDCSPCQRCSNHGVCLKKPGCAASCKCRGPWEGRQLHIHIRVY